MNTYDRNRNAIATGSMVMVADSGATSTPRVKRRSSSAGRTVWKQTAIWGYIAR